MDVGSGAAWCTHPVVEEGRDSGGVVVGTTLEAVVDGTIGVIENGFNSDGFNVYDVELTF